MIRKEKQAGLRRRLRFLAPLGPGEQIHQDRAGQVKFDFKRNYLNNSVFNENFLYL